MTEYEGLFSIPKDIIFPDELNKYLKDQIAAFTLENEMLKKHLEETEKKCVEMQKEIDHLKGKIKNDENPIMMPQFLDSSKIINTKIVELSKNLREKCAEMEKYKTKCSKLLTQLEEIKNRESEEKLMPVKIKEDTTRLENGTASDIKELQDKLNTTTNRMLDLKNANLQLRNELKQANRFLQQEIGEDFSSLQGNVTWKGRAQIICDLQNKNKKLKEKLQSLQEVGKQVDTNNQSEKFSGKIANLERENNELKSMNEACKSKIESLKSRSNMLETGYQELKLKMSQVQERSTKELEIIGNMSNQLAEAENKKRQALKEKDNLIYKLQGEVTNLQDQINNYKVLLTNLKQKKYNKNENNEEVDEPTKTNILKRYEILQESILNLEKEKENLLELVDVQKRRLENERYAHEKCQQLLRQEKQRATKLEAAVAKSELESASTNRTGYSVLSHFSRVTENNLKDQLELAEETIKALRTRLELEQLEKKEDFQEFAKILQVSNKKV